MITDSCMFDMEWKKRRVRALILERMKAAYDVTYSVHFDFYFDEGLYTIETCEACDSYVEVLEQLVGEAIEEDAYPHGGVIDE